MPIDPFAIRLFPGRDIAIPKKLGLRNKTPNPTTSILVKDGITSNAFIVGSILWAGFRIESRSWALLGVTGAWELLSE